MRISAGIIPAYAGNTYVMTVPLRHEQDHPRVCGEHCGEHSASFGVLGSSPRMRGTLTSRFAYSEAMGIIPAYAGNTRQAEILLPNDWDHPRVCGEHAAVRNAPEYPSGSSPRMRGTLIGGLLDKAQEGIIPAYAGNTRLPVVRDLRVRDHPRVCGEHDFCLEYVTDARGSSPRMRGTHHENGIDSQRGGIIPAYAGNTMRPPPPLWRLEDHPRVCGEHILPDCVKPSGMGSSPRMRGTPSCMVC